MSEPKPVAVPEKENRREYERSAVSLGGRLFLPAEQTEQTCKILDLSAGGARVICEEVPPTATDVILYVDGFGRFPAVITHNSDGAVGMCFDMTEKKRKRLTAQIRAYLQAGITGVTSLRRYKRVPTTAEGTFQCENGEKIACSIRDFSLQGAFLETSHRPPLDEVISIGPYQGRVIRHEAKGVAIQFVTRCDRVPGPAGAD